MGACLHRSRHCHLPAKANSERLNCLGIAKRPNKGSPSWDKNGMWPRSLWISWRISHGSYMHPGLVQRNLIAFDTIYSVQRRAGLRATNCLHAMTASENTYSGPITRQQFGNEAFRDTHWPPVQLENDRNGMIRKEQLWLWTGWVDSQHSSGFVGL